MLFELWSLFVWYVIAPLLYAAIYHQVETFIVCVGLVILTIWAAEKGYV